MKRIIIKLLAFFIFIIIGALLINAILDLLNIDILYKLRPIISIAFGVVIGIVWHYSSNEY